MEKQRWDEVKRILGDAIELPTAERGAFLDAACQDPEVRAEVETLLTAHRKADGFLEAPATAGLDLGLVGQRLGHYRIEAELGRGGMGVVYRAVRDDDFEKKVAIKVVARGNPELLRRFDQERRILGRLQHPNIAAILDGGTTPTGSPYLVMELVTGETIDAYCRSRRLSTRDRLALFATVCSAVSYAHQNLIVHRDLKPANILVTTDGQPRLLDFGIAKIIEPADDLAMAQTATFAPALTPAYASPEQVKNEPITTASDVYSLGVILYELLTGRRPYRVESQTLPELIEAVCDTIPRAPSAATTGRDGAATRGELDGDLDTIILMALRKEPERRYGSVFELGEDLRRHLDGRPVKARGDGAGYRLGKFVRRHRLALGAIAAVLLALVAGVVSTVRQARIAEHERATAELQRTAADRRFEQAREVARAFITEMDPALRHLAGATPVRRMIVDKGLLYLNRLAAESGNAPELLLDLATGYLRIGDILGHPDTPNLGDPAGATAAYERAMKLASVVVAQRPTSTGARKSLWNATQRLGRVTGTQGEVARGQALMRVAMGVVDQARALDPGDAELLRHRATTLSQLAWLELRAGRYDDARRLYQQSHDTSVAVLAAHPNHPDAPRDVLLAKLDLARSSLAAKKPAEAVSAAQDAVALAEPVFAAARGNAQAQRDLAFSLDTIVHALVMAQRSADAIPYAEKSLALAESLAAADPTSAQARRDMINATRNLGSALADAGRLKDAVSRHERSVQLADAAIAASPDDRLLKENLAASLHSLGYAHGALGDHAAAARALGRAVEVKEALVRAAPGDKWGRARLADMLEALAAEREKLGDAAAARVSRSRAAELRR